MITASHNPGDYNGFKVRTEYAGSAPPEILSQIEDRIPVAATSGATRMPLQDGRAQGLVHDFDPRPTYLDHIKTLVDTERLRNAGLRVVIDPMYGAGSGYLAELLSGGTNVVHEIRGERNPTFPGMHNPEPIARNLEATAESVREHSAQLALATDGDADRIGVMDGSGRFVDQLLTYGLLAYYLLEERGERGAMVKSVTTTSMIFRLGEAYGVPVYETPVGFKHLGPKMIESDAIIAGEESGGFAFRGHVPERDGVLSGLYIFDLMARRKKQLPGLIEDLFARAGAHHYDRIDITLTPTERAAVALKLPDLAPSAIAGVPVKSYDRTDGLRFILEDDSWALIRLSGTEPLMRIYTEVRAPELVQPVLQSVRELVGV
jgi:phosphomannomutase